MHSLAENQHQTLRCAVDRIIPADDYPGGWEAGGGDYLLRLLQAEPRFIPLYQSGLDALDLEAWTTSGAAFTDLSHEAQDALLVCVEAGAVQSDWPLDPSAFFQQLVAQVMEGFYADPGNGGNKDAVSWRMIGFRVTA